MMNTASQTSPVPEPQLAPPGAGLPPLERFIGGLLFALRRATSSRSAIAARFQAERERIRQLLAPLSAGQAVQRVLIPRVRGLEDSSRYWSAWMTLDHLRIVHEGMTRVIRALTSGVTPPGQSSTAAVKPRTDVDAGVVAAWEASCDALAAAVESVPESALKTAVRYAHPWFGPLDAFAWYCLAAGHHRIHRVQLERICAALAG